MCIIRPCRFRINPPISQLSPSKRKILTWSFLNIRRISRSTVSRSAANGPESTLPASLDVPIRKSDQVALSYFFSIGKSYLKFYKTGIKNIYYNYRASQTIQSLIDSKYDGAVSSAVRARAISRSDFQLLTRNWHDLKRVPLFGLVVALFGEFTPLIVIAFGSIVPLTCRIPAQIMRERKKVEDTRRKALQQIAATPPVEGFSNLDSKQLAQICASLGLTSRIWNLFGRPPSLIMKRKVQKRIEYLKLDDELIESAGGVQEMNDEEVIMALIERGVDVLRRDKSLLRDDLKSWLISRGRVPIVRLLLTRPSVWPARYKDHITLSH